jgi:PKD repeat protein
MKNSNLPCVESLLRQFSLFGRKIFPILLVAWLAVSASLHAQNSISIQWNNEVGCQIANTDEDPDRKDYEELIEDETCLRVCENSTVQYTLQGDDNSTWLSTVWNVTGGVISSSGTSFCNVNWGSSGGGSISATVTTTLGVQSLPLLCIELIKKPIALFTIEPFRHEGEIALCTKQDIYFTNTSSSNGGSEIVSYLWDFGDGNFSSEANPVHIYTNDGPYDITLEVTNACNCKSSFRMTVNVKRNGINIECPSAVCEGQKSTYSVPKELRERCREGMNWSVTGGIIVSPQPYRETIEVIWNNVNATGYGAVNFDTTSCDIECPSITSVKIPVITSRAIIQGDETICAKKQAKYILPQWPTTDFQWSIETTTGATLINTDQRNEVVIVAQDAGQIILRATYQNTLLNCGGVAKEFIITVTDPIEIIGPPQICIGSQTYSLPSGFSGLWTIATNAGVPVQSANGNSITRNFIAGNFTVSVTGSTFCTPEALKVKVLANPTIPDALQVLGRRIICPGTPYTYKFNNTVPGTVIGWDIVGGTFLGAKYGNEVTVFFTPGALPYSIKLWREYSSDPHCRSSIATIPINIPNLNLEIKEELPEGLTPCPSSTQNYSLNMFGTSTLYDDAEVYSWTVEDPLLGSISQGDGTNQVTVLWNETVDIPNPTTKLLVRVRKCNLFYDFLLEVTINKVPDLAITVPALICSGTPFQPTLSPAGLGYSVTWYVDDVAFDDDDILPEILVNNTNNAASATHTIKAIVGNYNNCETFIELTKEVTVYGIPEGTLSPSGDQYFCETVNPFTLSIATQPAGTTIKWFKDNIEITSAYNSSSFVVTAFGYYHIILTNASGCSYETDKVFVLNNCGLGGGCTITPEPAIILGSSPNGCLGVQVSASNIIGTPTSSYWSSSPRGKNCFCYGSLQSGSTTTQANYNFSEPDLYNISYFATYLGTNGEDCTKIYSTQVIVPYRAIVNSAIACNSTNGTYTVTFSDISAFYAQTPVETRTFIIDGVTYTQSAASKTVQLAPGNHTIKLIISRTGYPSCETPIETINLPDFPNATFTYSSNVCNLACGEVCFNKALLFTITNPLPNQTYLWEFDDGSKNTQQQPSKVYSIADEYLVKLTVKNEFGCENVFTKNVVVRANGLDGTVSATPPLTCEGNTITLNYNNGNPLSVVTNYQWMRDNNPLGTTNVGTFTVNESGSYWVKTQDNFGCTSETFSSPAAFVMVPDAVVLGPDAVCQGQQFQLSGYAGGTTTQYQWLKDGTVFLAWNNENYKLDDTLVDTAQLFTYTLQVRVPNGAGWCYLPDQTKGVMVYGPPAPPQVSFATVANSCNPYNLNVFANSIGNATGTFTWSNGQSASNTSFHDITVFQGGPLKVTFTNPAGCSASTTVIIPKDPSVYMWIFPEGCYQSCTRPDEFLLGPNQEFVNWQWNVNGVAASNGSSFVDDFELPGASSSINLVLDNGLCERTSRTMTNTIEKCVDCKFEVKLSRLTVKTDPFCHYILDFDFFNHNNFDMMVTVTTGNGIGIFIPATLTLPPGASQHALTMVPGNNFVGGVVTFTFQSINDRGERCIVETLVDFGEPCNQIAFRPSNEESFTEETIGKIQKLDIAPNPANQVTELYYEYPDTITMEDRLEIYDVLGRLLATHKPTNAKGKWSLSLHYFATGHYIVLMKKNNQILLQKNLIVK